MHDIWIGSTKTNGGSGCGVVIEEVDRDKCITISGLAVLLRMCIAMAAEVVGVCGLNGFWVLVQGRNLSMEAINRCIDAVVKLH